MSKAFTKENDEGLDEDEDRTPPSTIAQAGGKNYITPLGFQRLQEELRLLKTKERPHYTEVVAWAASNGDRSENADYHYGKRKLREIDRRIRYLTMQIDSAVVVDPIKNASDQVFFGATVVILDEDDVERTYRIVGVDEMDPAEGKISWLSPLAHALMKGRAGDYVTFQSPKGERSVEIVDVRYESIG